MYNEASAVFVVPDVDESKLPENFTGAIVPSEEKRSEALDEDMNEVYKSLRVVLPVARFAKVHEEQVAWLKKRDVAKSVEEKSKSIEERTRTLRDLGWFGGE